MDTNVKNQIQRDYNKITDFSGDWLPKLSQKHNVSESDILDNLNF